MAVLISLSFSSVSINPLPRNNVANAIHHSKLPHKILPLPTLRRNISLYRPIIINRNAVTSVECDHVPRRTANHHPNLWDDDFIQSLPKHPYQAASHGEQAETLIKDIKNIFNAMDGTSSMDDVSERLVMVDNVERLGISRHFQNEIKQALHYVYRYWNECNNLDLNTTSLGLRILRLNRYPVSSDVLQRFRTKDGQFLCFKMQSEEEEIKGVLNLFRASLIVFPNEKVMDEAKAFATTYLNQALLKPELSSHLSQEIKFNLEYGWYTNLPRIEARNYMDIYDKNTSWARLHVNKKLICLAKLDFNITQSFHLHELQILSRWWRDSRLCELSFSRHRHVEYHFLGCAISAEEKNYAFRITLAKLSALGTYIDDIYDTYGTIDELKLFTKTIKKWNPSPPNSLPNYMKIAYKALYDTISESAREAEKTQGRDTFNYICKAWEAYIDSLMKEAEWLAVAYIPTLKEHLENGKVSSGSRPTSLPALLTLDALLPENILQKIDYPSRFDELFGLNFRLRGDTRTFKTEADRGEVASSISGYMRDHPGSNEEDALNYLNNLLNEVQKELNWEYLKKDNAPTIVKDHAYNFSRGVQLFYKERDGFSISTEDIKKYVTQILIDPVPM